MNIVNVATTNQKGQLVIPAAMRAQLGITDQVMLKISLKGNEICISPIRELVTEVERENSYLEVLKKTQGSCEKDEIDSAQEQRELVAAEKRRKAW